MDFVHNLGVEEQVAFWVGKGKHAMGKGGGKAQRSSDGLNPTGKDGKRMLCHLCGSGRHFMMECPKGRSTGPSSSSHLVAFTQTADVKDNRVQSSMDFLSILMVEQIGWKAEPLVHQVHLTDEYKNCLTIDFGATANLAGRSWADSMIECMTHKIKKDVLTRKNPRTFKFANAQKTTVDDDTTFPITLTTADETQIKGSYRAHIIEKDCPALWCLPSIRALGGVVDTGKDVLTFPGKLKPLEFKLVYTSKGHYTVPLNDKFGGCDSTPKLAFGAEEEPAATPAAAASGAPAGSSADPPPVPHPG